MYRKYYFKYESLETNVDQNSMHDLQGDWQRDVLFELRFIPIISN